MAKKAKDRLQEFIDIFGPKDDKKKYDEKAIKKIFQVDDPHKLEPEDFRLYLAASVMVQYNITPELYKTFYKAASANPIVNIFPLDQLFGNGDEDLNDEYEDFDDEEYEDDEPDDIPSPFGFSSRSGRESFFKRESKSSAKPIKDADKKTLLLKIQLRDIKNPPLWREVKVPADYDFLQLHDIIQLLFGWEHSHLWQFEKKPYGHGAVISEPLPEPSPWDDGPSDIAGETPITAFLQKKGDKFVYVYDFGDDWIHDITVVDVLDEKIDSPVCTKFKGDNAIEDVGGTYGLQMYRDMADPKVKISKEREEEFLENNGFEDKKDFMALMDDLKFDIDYINSELKSF